MTVETFFEKFELLADAPNAVAKMRELVLQLAVDGRLVPQNPAEGTGEPLLREIRKQNPPLKKEMESDGESVPLPSYPSSWATARLGEVASIVRGVSFPGSAKSKQRGEGEVACLRTASVQADIDWDDLIYISPEHVSRDDQWVAPNDVIISMANSYELVGKVAIVREVPQRTTFGAFLAALRAKLIDPFFLLYVLRSPGMQAAFRDSSSQTTNIANISLGRMRPMPFPLPPLAEQKRIAAKVDELMALCDRLEAEQAEREAKHTVLARAALARFAEAPTPANLVFLFHDTYTIDPADLRKSILTLAVQGKLVKQDPSDEPAIDLVANALAKLSPEKRKRVPKPLPPVDDPPFELPSAWTWARFQDIAFIASNLVDPKPYGSMLHLAPDNIQKGTGALLPCRTVREDEVKSGNHRFFSGQLVYSKIRPNLSKVVWVDFDGLCSADMYPIDSLIDPRYLMRYMLSEAFMNQAVKTDTRVAMPKINQNELNAIAVPVPPLPEQRRIVAKVDQLMALVDRLEAQLAESRAAAERLMEAVVAELTSSAGAQAVGARTTSERKVRSELSFAGGHDGA